MDSGGGWAVRKALSLVTLLFVSATAFAEGPPPQHIDFRDDFTSGGIAEMLSQYLSPRLAELMRK